MAQHSTNSDLANVLRVLRRRAWIIVLCVVATGAAAYFASKAQRKEYTASASLLFENTQLQQQAAGLPGVQVVSPQSQQDTNVKLATLPGIQDRAARDLRLTSSEIQSKISVSSESDTDLVTVSATAATPAAAAHIANVYARVAVNYREQLDRAFYANSLRAVNTQYQALTPAERSTSQGTALRSRIQSLQTLQDLQGSEVQLAQPATPPTGPSSPKVARNTAIGVFLGLVLGLVIAFGLERFDRRLREPSDLEAAYGLPVLGVVPESQALKVKRSKSSSAPPLPGKEAEIFGLLRAHIRYSNVDRRVRVILVVSAAPGDGKSTVARNLALVAARAGERTLFVEADLRRPTAAADFGVSKSPGIAEALVEGMPLEEAVQKVDATSGSGQTGAIDVLVAGGVLPPNPTQVIESQAMESLLERARAQYDLVVIDTPPLALLSDAFPLLREVDGVLIVSRLGHNRRDVAARLRSTLEAANAPVLGVVANGYKERSATPYGYGYGYGYGSYLNGKGDQVQVEQASSNGASIPTATNGTSHPEETPTAQVGSQTESGTPSGRSSRRRSGLFGR